MEKVESMIHKAKCRFEVTQRDVEDKEDKDKRILCMDCICITRLGLDKEKMKIKKKKTNQTIYQQEWGADVVV